MGIALVTSSDPALAVGAPPNDYPTEARADYVFACMQVNGPDARLAHEVLVLN